MTQEVHPLAELVEQHPTGSAANPPSTTAGSGVYDTGYGSAYGAPVDQAELMDSGETDDLPKQGFWRKRRGFGLGRLSGGTLGAQLLTGVVAVVLIVVTATGVTTYFALHSYLMGRLDKQLNTSAGIPQINRLLQNNMYANPNGGSPSVQKVYLAFLAADGTAATLTIANTSVLPMTINASTRSNLIANADSHRTVTTTDGARLRVVAEAVSPETLPDGTTLGYVVVGLSTNEIDRTMHRLILLELIVGLGAILLASGATYWGVRVSLGPLKRVTRTAQEVTAELSSEGTGLDRRVPDSASTTEVGQLASSFNTMLDTVEAEFQARRESEERMRQFLADASHELRTPLTSIRGYAELEKMQRSRRGITPSEDDDAIDRIEAEGTRMSRLVEDLLILARGDDAANDGLAIREPVQIGDVVANVVSDVRAVHPTRSIEGHTDPGLTVLGDQDQILRMLRNLATNAAVHTDPAGAIRVEAHRDGPLVVLQVIDQGPGLPPDEAAHVFERFWRADKARTRVRGGSGLGMSIVAQIAEAHGGQVYFDSSVERGSTVTVTLPAGLSS